MNCPICQPSLSREQGWEVWRLGPEKGARYASLQLGERVSPEEIKRHLQNHAAEQPPYKAKPKKTCIEMAESVSDRERDLLLFLERFPAADLETLALAFFDSGNRNSALRSANRSTSKLMQQDLLYRLYMRSLPGSGPRPKPDPSPFYFLGGASAAWIKQTTGERPRKSSLVKERDQFSEWQQAWSLWKRGEALRILLRLLQPLSPGIRGLGETSLSPSEVWSGLAIPGTTKDPLLGQFRLRPDAVVGIHTPVGTTPLMIWGENKSKSGKQIAGDISKAGAIARSGAVQQLLPGAQAPVALFWTSGVERVNEIFSAINPTIIGAQRAIAADTKTAIARPDGDVWRDLQSGEWLSLEEALRRNSL